MIFSFRPQRRPRTVALLTVSSNGVPSDGAAVVIGISVQPAPNQAEAAGQAGEAGYKSPSEAEIRKANADYATALEAGNLDAILAFWAPDADYIDETGKQTQGRDNIAALFRKALPELEAVA